MTPPGAPQIGVDPAEDGFAADFDTGLVIIGAGACGMVAALAAHERGEDVLVIERDAAPSGSTALSAGLIPAAGTRFQRAAGIDDDPQVFATDIQRKAHGENDPALVDSLARGSAPLIEWLADRYGLPFSLVDDFDYPGHTQRRMHGLPSRSGRELVDRLRTACEDAGIAIITERRATRLHADASGRVTGITMLRPDGAVEQVGCDKLVLACNGFGGNPQMVRNHMPDIADALYFGHGGNQGEAMIWGEALGARIRHPGAYQGHGNVAHPHGILITWAVMGEGGFQVDRTGRRFWNEAQGYSEAARAVLARPGGEAFSIFDERIAGIAAQFADFRDAQDQGAIREAATIPDLARAIGVPEDALAQSFDEVSRARESGGADAFGRDFTGLTPLTPPYRAVRVTGALFHTQGGLETDGAGRIRHRDGGFLPNLRAAGGAACGVSGAGDAGYLSGNGLLAATVLGRAAGLWRDE